MSELISQTIAIREGLAPELISQAKRQQNIGIGSELVTKLRTTLNWWYVLKLTEEECFDSQLGWRGIYTNTLSADVSAFDYDVVYKIKQLENQVKSLQAKLHWHGL